MQENYDQCGPKLFDCFKLLLYYYSNCNTNNDMTRVIKAPTLPKVLLSIFCFAQSHTYAEVFSNCHSAGQPVESNHDYLESLLDCYSNNDMAQFLRCPHCQMYGMSCFI